MTEPMKVQDAPLGHPFTPDELTQQCHYIVGGVSWPSKVPGFAVILAVTGNRKAKLFDMHLLDEAEHIDLRQLIRRCSAMDAMYRPSDWVGDGSSKAARTIMEDVAQEQRNPAMDDEGNVRTFTHVRSSPLLGIQKFYAYAVPLMWELTDPKNKRLYFKGSAIVGYLTQIKPDEHSYLSHGSYPAVEAMAFALRDALEWIESEKQAEHWSDGTDMADSYGMETAL